MSNQDSYNSLYRHKLSGQSSSSPILRWTGNSPIWGKITVPTRGSFMYDFPTHADLAYANLTQWVQLLQPYVPTQHRSPKWTIDRMADRYIVFEHLEKSSLEHTRTSYSRQFLARTASSHTCHQPEHRNILAKSMPKIDQHAKLNITVNK